MQNFKQLDLLNEYFYLHLYQRNLLNENDHNFLQPFSPNGNHH